MESRHEAERLLVSSAGQDPERRGARPQPYRPPGPLAVCPRSRPSWLGPILLLALASCGADARAWQRRLTDPDPYEAYLAALELCAISPPDAAPGLSLLFDRLEDPLAWNRTASLQAIARLEQEARPVLLEHLVLEGRDRPVVRDALLPVFERASREERRRTLELVSKHGWNEAPELRQRLLEDARSDPEWTKALSAELQKKRAKGDRELRRFLREAGVQVAPERER